MRELTDIKKVAAGTLGGVIAVGAMSDRPAVAGSETAAVADYSTWNLYPACLMALR